MAAGIGIVDNQGLDRRIVELGQRMAQQRHIDDAGFARRAETRAAGPAFERRCGSAEKRAEVES